MKWFNEVGEKLRAPSWANTALWWLICLLHALRDVPEVAALSENGLWQSNLLLSPSLWPNISELQPDVVMTGRPGHTQSTQSFKAYAAAAARQASPRHFCHSWFINYNKSRAGALGVLITMGSVKSIRKIFYNDQLQIKGLQSSSLRGVIRKIHMCEFDLWLFLHSLNVWLSIILWPRLSFFVSGCLFKSESAQLMPDMCTYLRFK